MRAPASKFWLVACGIAAVVLIAIVFALLQVSRRRPATTLVMAPTPQRCALPEEVPIRALSEAEAPPVLLWASGQVRIYVDEVATFSPPEDPKRLAPGEHRLRVEAEGHEPLRTSFRIDPYTPALIHAQLDDALGITLARLGTVCTSCPAPSLEVELDVPTHAAPTDLMLVHAARALRSDDWKSAAGFLASVAVSRRSEPLFRRLAAAVYVGAAQPSDARRELAAVAQRSSELKMLLERLEQLEGEERRREREVLLARWNRTTERFGHLMERFQGEVPGEISNASLRLAALSRSFEQALRDDDLGRQEAALRAGEEVLSLFVHQLRSRRPADCTFQAAVLATLGR